MEFPYDSVLSCAIPFYLVRFRFISCVSVLSRTVSLVSPKKGNYVWQRRPRPEVPPPGELLRSPTEWDASPSPTPENTTFKLQRIPDAYQKIQNCVCENTTLGPQSTGCLTVNRRKRRFSFLCCTASRTVSLNMLLKRQPCIRLGHLGGAS